MKENTIIWIDPIGLFVGKLFAILKDLHSRFLEFWEKNPAFFYGLSIFLGSLFAIQTPWALLTFLLLLHRSRCLPACALFLTPCCYLYLFYASPQTHSFVKGKFYIKSIQKSEKYGSSWEYSGILKTDDGRIRCMCYSKIAYDPAFIYLIHGVLRGARSKSYCIKVVDEWQPVKKRFTLVTYRTTAQDGLKNYIEKKIPLPRAAHFLMGMLTGNLKDRVMKHEFNQLGLSHLMAVSGLHFSLVILLFHYVLKWFLPYKAETVVLILIMTFYLLFIGEAPSVLRAWTSSILFFLGILFEKRTSAINSLGVALILCLLWDPLSATTLSFQLSFLATAGILFFYPLCNTLLEYWLPKLKLQDAIAKKRLWQHTYILIAFFRESLALTLSVHIAILPLLLHTFHSFSINSLIYNLFFPFLACTALIFFLLSIPLGTWAHTINGYYCGAILKIPETPPLFFKTFYCQPFDPWLLTSLLTLLLLFAINLKTKKKEAISLIFS